MDNLEATAWVRAVLSNQTHTLLPVPYGYHLPVGYTVDSEHGPSVQVRTIKNDAWQTPTLSTIADEVVPTLQLEYITVNWPVIVSIGCDDQPGMGDPLPLRLALLPSASQQSVTLDDSAQRWLDYMIRLGRIKALTGLDIATCRKIADLNQYDDEPPMGTLKIALTLLAVARNNPVRAAVAMKRVMDVFIQNGEALLAVDFPWFYNASMAKNRRQSLYKKVRDILQHIHTARTKS